MEPSLGTGLGTIWAFIAWPYLITFILFASLIKKAFGDWLEKITKSKWKDVYTVLVIAAVIGVPFGFSKDITWVQVLITYGLGTSFHETIWTHIERAVAKLLEKVFG